jgi:hypothetical protein
MNTSRLYRSPLDIAFARIRVLLLPLAFAALASMIGFTSATAAAPVVEDDPGSPADLSRLGTAYLLIDAVFNDGDADVATALVSENAVIHTTAGDFVGPQGLLDYIAMVKRAYPDAWFELSTVSVSDRGISLEWTMTATRYRIGPNEPTMNVNVEIPTVATISIDDAQITDAAFGNTEVATASQAPVSVSPNHGDPF